MTACVHPDHRLRNVEPVRGHRGCFSATCAVCSRLVWLREDGAHAASLDELLERDAYVGEIVAGHEATLHRAAPERAHISPQSVRLQ